MSKRTRKGDRARLASGANPETNFENCPKHTPIIGIKIYRWALTARGPQCRIPFDPIRYHWHDSRGASHTLLFRLGGGEA